MSRGPRFIILDGTPYLWREVLRIRKEQLRQAAQERQLALFELREDCRADTLRTAYGRYLEPSLFDG